MSRREMTQQPMKLFTQRLAPNPTKVELYLEEKRAAGCDIDVERVMVNLVKGEQRSAAITEKNPLQRVPFLELNDGMVIFESLPIIEFFEELFPTAPMLGATPAERGIVRSIERMIDADLLRNIAIHVHMTRSPAGYGENPAVAEWALAALAKPLGFLEELLSDQRRYIAGAELTVADCALAAALQFARYGKLNLLADRPDLSLWDEMYRGRAAAKSVLVF